MSFDAEIFTIGHSTHTWDRFVDLLRLADATAIADIRSAPYSRHTPQFSSDELKDRLERNHVAYVFLGRELGGRPYHRSLFINGIADYEAMALTSEFKLGLDRVISGIPRFKIALMCAERDPLDCHRFLLVARQLAVRGVRIGHILADGRIETHAETEERLLALENLSSAELFADQEQRLILAYRARGRRVAYAEVTQEPDSSKRQAVR